MGCSRNRLSRRSLLKRAAMLSAVAAIPGILQGRAHAQAKASKDAMRYQPTPQGEKRCANCIQYIVAPNGAEGACKVVEGPVSPDGYCIVWAPAA